jgi:hypothetical protein
MKQLLLLMTAVLMAVPSVGYAQIVETNTVANTGQAAFPLPPAASDLILGGSSTFSSLTSNYVAFVNAGQTWAPISALNDGSLGLPTNSGSAVFQFNNLNSSTPNAPSNFAYTVTFTLNTSVNTQGYNLTGIESFAGWASGQPDDPRVAQAYSVLYSTVADPTNFLSLANVTYSPFSAKPAAGSYSSEVSLTATSGFVASNVAALQFQIVAPPTYSPFALQSMATMYREIDVLGTAVAVPEPSSYVLLGAGLLILFVFRRQARINA